MFYDDMLCDVQSDEFAYEYEQWLETLEMHEPDPDDF